LNPGVKIRPYRLIIFLLSSPPQDYYASVGWISLIQARPFFVYNLTIRHSRDMEQKSIIG